MPLLITTLIIMTLLITTLLKMTLVLTILIIMAILITLYKRHITYNTNNIKKCNITYMFTFISFVLQLGFSWGHINECFYRLNFRTWGNQKRGLRKTRAFISH
jgi:hypothetical protein